MWDYIDLGDCGQGVPFLFLHREILLCMDFRLFRIILQLFNFKIVYVLEIQLVVLLKMGVGSLLVFLHFDSFLSFITVNVRISMWIIGWIQFKRRIGLLAYDFFSNVLLWLMLVTWFLIPRSIIDCHFEGFYLLSLLNCGVLVLRLFLSLRLRFFVLKIVFEKFVFVCLNFFSQVFVVLFLYILLFVCVVWLRGRIFRR